MLTMYLVMFYIREYFVYHTLLSTNCFSYILNWTKYVNKVTADKNMLIKHVEWN